MTSATRNYFFKSSTSKLSLQNSNSREIQSMKAVEIFMIRKSFRPNSSEAIRKEAEDLINEKHYQGYRLINVDFDVADNAGYIYAFVTMKRPNTY